MKSSIPTSLAAAALLGAAGAVHSADAPPTPGRYAGQMCVSTGGKAPSCGPAQLELLPTAEAFIQISDIVYRLRLGRQQIDVMLMHGAMQIDGFSAIYHWVGQSLQFSDPDKDVRYDIRWGAPLRTSP